MEINTLSRVALEKLFSKCCTSTAWVQLMLRDAPFVDASQVCLKADINWRNLQEADYLEAFLGHPKIGDVASLRKKYGATRQLSSEEQSGVDVSDEATLIALQQGNEAFENKFGFIFIVCATGKSARQMLDLLNERITLDRSAELKNAIEQQRQIFQIRLEAIL